MVLNASNGTKNEKRSSTIEGRAIVSRGSNFVPPRNHKDDVEIAVSRPGILRYP